MPRLQIPEKLLFLLEPKRYKVAHGGRGSAKSWSFARALLMLGTTRPMRILCTREIQKSIRQSVHTLLEDQIKTLGIGHHYESLRTEIRGKNGTLFSFSGLADHTVDSIKSFEGVDIVWVEEAQTVSKRSWEILIPTIRKPGSEVWVSFNPDMETDDTYQRFVTNPPENSIIRKVNWDDNPWFPKELEMERIYLARVDPDAYSNVWLGNCRTMSDAQVMRGKYIVEAFEPDISWDGPYYGADWGFSQDPTTLVKLWVFGRTLYVEHEAWGLQVDIEATPALFDLVPGARQNVIRADSARPETISHMNKRGFNIHHAVKGKGSVEDGIAHIRSYEQVVIHPRCAHALHEFQHYRYKVDRLSGDILPTIVDADNHVIDAARYALEPLMGGKGIKKPKEAPTRDRHPVSHGWMA